MTKFAYLALHAVSLRVTGYAFKRIVLSSLNVKVRGTTVRAHLCCVEGEMPWGDQIPTNLSGINAVPPSRLHVTVYFYIA
jgi:hypothetical protein